MSSQQQRLRRALVHFQLSRSLNKPLLRLRPIPLFTRHPLGIPSQRIGLRHAIKQIRLAATRETTKRTVTNLIALLVKLARLQMLAHECEHLCTHVVTIDRVHLDSIQKTLCRRHASFFVTTRTPPAFEEL